MSARGYPDMGAARGPDLGVGGAEERQNGRTDGGGQVRDAGIVADVQASSCQPAGQVIEIVDAYGAGKRGVVFAGAPFHRHHAL